MSIKWENPKDQLPKEGRYVWVLIQHPKEHNPLSCSLFCGIVEKRPDGKEWRVLNADFLGLGCQSALLQTDNPDITYYDIALAWVYAKDFVLPEWIPHDKHWGKLGAEDF